MTHGGDATRRLRRRIDLLLLSTLCILFLFPMAIADPKYQQPLYADTEEPMDAHRPKKIAIIGGGVVGVTVAYLLRHFHDGLIPPQVTIFERQPRLGGRIHTIRSYEDAASTFDTDDSLISVLAEHVGVDFWDLDPKILRTPLSLVSTWDGEKVVLQELDRVKLTWKTLARIVWQNLRSSRFWDQLALDVRNIWLDPWDRWYGTVGRDGPDKDVLARFARSWGFSIKPQMAVKGGNQAFLEKLDEKSEVWIGLNLNIWQINKFDNRTYVHWHEVDGLDDNAAHFDAVVIAAPFDQRDIQIWFPHSSIPEKPAYTPLHVTHFISRQPLDPTTFALAKDKTVPDLLWNLNSSKKEDSKPTPPSFLALERSDEIYFDGCIREVENMYKIISKEPFSDDDIATLLKKTGVAREDITFPDQSCYPLVLHWPVDDIFGDGEDLKMRDEYVEIGKERGYNPIGPTKLYDNEWYWSHFGCVMYPTVRWVHRQYWPNGAPVVDHDLSNGHAGQQFELAPGLFYTSGFERQEGASVSRSVASAVEVARRLQSGGWV